jgi:hypothetical protein
MALARRRAWTAFRIGSGSRITGGNVKHSPTLDGRALRRLAEREVGESC